MLCSLEYIFVHICSIVFSSTHLPTHLHLLLLLAPVDRGQRQEGRRLIMHLSPVEGLLRRRHLSMVERMGSEVCGRTLFLWLLHSDKHITCVQHGLDR